MCPRRRWSHVTRAWYSSELHLLGSVILTTVLLILPWLPAAGQAVAAPSPNRVAVRGFVIDMAGVRIDGAIVRLVGRGVEARTDSLGRFRLPAVAPGLDTLLLRRIGIQPLQLPITLAVGDTAELVLFADWAPAMMEALRIEGKALPSRIDEFNERVTGPTARSSQFLTRAQLEALPAVLDAVDLLRRMPSLLVQNTGPRSVAIRLRRGSGSLQGCVPALWLDGSHLGSTDAAQDMLRSYRPGDLEGIEVYDGGASMPVEYNVGGCGAILLWSRR